MPQPAARLDVDWVAGGLLPFADFRVGSLVPTVFRSYARLLHPAWDRDGRPVRWDAVAQWSGRRLHSLAEFELLAAPLGSPSTPAPFARPPDEGRPPSFVLDTLCAYLETETRTPTETTFGVWEGYHWVRTLDRALPKIELPERTYVALVAPLRSIGDFGWNEPSGVFAREPPSIMFPADRAWFVVSDVDQDSTYVGGSRRLVSALLAEPSLEAWEVGAADGITAGVDTYNV